ncbi:MAG: hypothetical protein GEU83_05225 [Pseudonocardiaceae bacterium]|nr:hypothetical protein [Pseudonocardiaceae bacterium]
MTTTSPAPSTGVDAPGRVVTRVRTLRTDRWWLPPLLTFLGLTAFLVYGLVRTAMQNYYWVAEHHFLTPFYSPCMTMSCLPEAAHFGRPFPEFPALVPYAIIGLPFLLLFRLTCYYYRKAYYRSFWLSPPACAVTEPHRGYSGETRFPLIMQNVHRYFFYAVVVVTAINTYDAILAFSGENGFGIGLGNLILVVNVLLLWGYTLSCHSCRHAVGGRLKHFSKHPVRYRLWTWVTKLNTRHMEFAWITLGTLILTDAYIALLSAGVISDLRIVN